MKKMFAALILCFASAVFAEDSGIEVIPISITTELTQTKKLSDRKELEIIGKHPPGTVPVVNPYSGIENGKDFSFQFKMAFLGEVQNLKVKKIEIDEIKIGIDGNITFFHGDGLNKYKGLLTAQIFFHSSSITALPQKIEKIKGVATLEKYSSVTVEIKDVLSMNNKTFTNEELQKIGVELGFKNIDPDCFQTTILSKKRFPVDYDFTFTKHGDINTEDPQPEEFDNLQGSGGFSETSVSHTGLKTVSITGGRNSATSVYEVNGNKFIVNKIGLSENSTLKLKIMIPEKEYKIPFCFENIELP